MILNSLFALILLFFISCNNARDTWTQPERENYVITCTETLLKKGWDSLVARNHCTCMQEKKEKKNPYQKDAVYITEEERMEWARECMGIK